MNEQPLGERSEWRLDFCQEEPKENGGFFGRLYIEGFWGMCMEQSSVQEPLLQKLRWRQSCLGSLAPPQFHMNFRIHLSITKKKACWNYDWVCGDYRSAWEKIILNNKPVNKVYLHSFSFIIFLQYLLVFRLQILMYLPSHSWYFIFWNISYFLFIFLNFSWFVLECKMQ